MARIPIDIVSGTIKKQSIVVGIDLGTTNSLVAYVKDGRPQTILNEEKTTIVPSLVYFENENKIIAGNKARQHLIKHPENTIYSVKRLMGKSYKDITQHAEYFGYKITDDPEYSGEGLVKINVKGKFYTPIELSSFILKELKKNAERELGMEISSTVITVPAYFNDSQRQATRDAGKLAGLDVLRIVNEPTAASLAYGLGVETKEEKIIAVYDLGGGTFDISILKIHPDSSGGIFEVLSTNGDTYLGGDDFDRALVEYWLKKNNLNASEILSQKNLSQALRLKAEEAKKSLSQNESYSDTLVWEKLKINCAVSQNEFEKIISPIIEKTQRCCLQAVKDAKIKTDEINVVILVGGSTRVPLVKKTVREIFGKIPYDKLNPDEVVALGAAVQADILAGNRKDILLLDVTPLSLGIETMGGLMDVIIPRNSKVPTKAGRQYTTKADGQVNMKISVYQGERELVSENRKLAEFDLQGIPAMPAGLPKVEISFTLNADGILTVSAQELRSGVQQQIEVKPAYGLTDEEVEKMLAESLTHAGEDMEKRMLIEARTEAEQMLSVTENFLLNNKEQLTQKEILETEHALDELVEAIKRNKRDELLQKIESLNEISKPYAERIMNQVITETMKGKKI